MKIHKFIILTSATFLFSTGLSFGQTKTTDLFHDANGNTFHQIFLDFPVSQILEIQYADQTQVEGEITSDGYSIVIKNYAGDKSVKLKVIDVAGETREVTKSRCYIDPILLNL